MRGMLMTFKRIRQFRDDSRAVAAVEFALILPLLIGLYIGAIEGATLYSADHKVATVASTIADLVSREKGELKETDLTTYFKAAQTIMQPYPTTELVQTVSLLTIDSSGVAKVKWSKAYPATQTGRAVDSVYPLAATTQINILARGAGGWLVASEVSYLHKPIVGVVFSADIDLRHVQYYLPRFNGEIKLK